MEKRIMEYPGVGTNRISNSNPKSRNQKSETDGDKTTAHGQGPSRTWLETGPLTTGPKGLSLSLKQVPGAMGTV